MKLKNTQNNTKVTSIDTTNHAEEQVTTYCKLNEINSVIGPKQIESLSNFY